MATEQIIRLADEHKNDNGNTMGSAHVCLRDAERHAAAGEDEAARIRALKSLAYSVGVFHPVYAAAALPDGVFGPHVL